FTSLLRPTLINEAKFGFNRLDLAFNCLGTDVIDQFFPVDAFGRGSDLSTSGLTAFGCQALVSNGQQRRTGTWQADDNLTWVKGSHTLKFGFEFRYIFDNGFDSFFSRPNLTLNFASSFQLSLVDLDPSTPCDAFDTDPTTNGCEGSTNADLQNLAGAYYGLVDFSFQSQFFDSALNRTPDNDRKFRQREWAGYVQDSWKIRPNLTLNLGLRYEFKGVPFEANGLLSNLFADPSGSAPFTFELVGPDAGRLFYNNDTTNFEPRIGFSWDPFKDGKTAIRGGYGIFHDRIFGNLFGNSRGAPPFQRDVQNFPGDVIENLAPAATQVASFVVEDCIFDFFTFACANQGLIAPSLVDPNLKIPYSQNWNLGVQRELPGNVLLDVNYVGSKGTRLFRVVDGNPPQPDRIADLLAMGFTDSDLEDTLIFFDPAVFGVFPISAFNNTAFGNVFGGSAALNRSIGFSNYHALQLNATKRFSRGFQIQGAYTWSHAIDNAPDPIDAAEGNRNFPRNSFNLDQERGSSDFDLRHRLVVNYTWELPFGKGQKWGNSGVLSRVLEGFSLSGIITLQSGHPFDIFGNRDSEHTNLSNRGSLLGTPSFPGTTSDQTGPSLGAPNCEIDTLLTAPFCDFVLPSFGGPGNTGRNRFTGPQFHAWDFTVGKTTSITERIKFNLRVEVYNAFNRAQFLQPGNLVQDPGTFGLSTGTITRSDGTTSARQIQIGAKITF
ncbi:MAG: TonB-dependent receptor, partial [Acidobacteria bacterium]|nr:TonB-dependent receptor [Acidobacteriota bacterium]